MSLPITTKRLIIRPFTVADSLPCYQPASASRSVSGTGQHKAAGAAGILRRLLLAGAAGLRPGLLGGWARFTQAGDAPAEDRHRYHRRRRKTAPGAKRPTAAAPSRRTTCYAPSPQNPNRLPMPRRTAALREADKGRYHEA